MTQMNKFPKIALTCATLIAAVLTAQTPAPKPVAPKAAAPKAAAAKPAAEPTGVDAIIELVKGGMSEAMVLRTIRSEGTAYKLAPADMLKLQRAGVSENVINTMLEPAAAAPAAPVQAAAPPAAPVQAAPVAEVTSSLPSVAKVAKKRRIAVMPFDFAAVQTWVNYWFQGSNVNVGQGIRAMLTARMGAAKNITLLERARLDAIESELKLNNTSLVNQGTKVKMGKVSGADCLLLGDVVIFGRDDRSERKGVSATTFGPALRRIPGIGNSAASVGKFSKEEKAVVAIVLRIVDTETGEVLDTAEARGESSRSSKDWSVFANSSGNSVRNSDGMTSSNFQATIIGEATSNAVDMIIKLLDEKVPQLPLRTRSIEGRVARAAGTTVILGFGSTDGVEKGDRFEILQIVNEVRDPVTKEVLDVETRKVGEFVVSEAREKIANGTYAGQAVLESYQKGYMARLITQ
jgi:curli biogenesis system outer membrane secretion channel CsgG